MFLKGKDYLSIWDIAHRWAGIAPDSTDEENLPDEVQYLIHKMVEGYWNNSLRIRRSSGYVVPRERLWILIFNINIWQKALERCLFDNEFKKAKLDNYYVKRTELIRLCEKEEIEPPEFWKRNKPELLQSPKLTINHRPKDEITDRLVCQAIAKTYWDIDPQIHPAHMAKARAIILYANGRHYKDENTIKSWIVEVDPLKDQRKIGRPKDVNYLIDLETGVLASKI